MPDIAAQPKSTPVRRIGALGTISRLSLGAVFIGIALGQGVGLSDLAIGLLVFPAAVSAVLAMRGTKAPRLRLYGLTGYGLTFAVWGIAYGVQPVPTLLFAGATQILAAARGYAGCELLAVSNWLRHRDDQIACPVHSIIDSAEARASAQQRIDAN